MVLTAAVKTALNNAWDDSSKGIMGRWKSVLQVLMCNNVAYKAKLAPCNLLVHPQNRGGSGIQPFNMHQKGAKIVACGAKFDLLIGSVAFEMHPEEAKRMKQVQFNENLALTSNGLMAPVQGGERYLTVSSTHTSQFCRAVSHGCLTPETQIQDSNGKLSLEMLGKDTVLKEMVTEGWEWVIIPWYVEDAFPGMPAMIADALNSVNGIFEAQGELELALTIANAALRPDGNVEWDALAASCCISSQISTYAKWIGKLVKNLGGGREQGYPLIKFAQEFQKQFGNSCLVGKDFFMSLLDIELSSTNMMVFVKIAVLATQVSAPDAKRVDGFSRFLTKGDLMLLKSKKLHDKVVAAETMLAQCWQRVAGSNLSERDRNRIFGLLCIRMVLHLLGKEKHGRDTTEFANIHEIETAFSEDLVAKNSQAVVPSSSAQGCEDAVTLEKAQSPMFLASVKVGLQVGKYYSHRYHTGMAWMLMSMDDDKAIFEYTNEVSGETHRHEMNGKQIIDCMRKIKHKSAVTLQGPALAACFPTSQCQQELLKVAIFQKLFEAYQTKDTDETMIKCMLFPGKGPKVFALKAIKKQELILVPMSEQVSGIQLTEPKTKLWGTGKFEGNAFYVLPPKVGTVFTPETTVVPFFLMKEQEQGQMVPYQMDFGKMKISCLRNHVAIEQFAEIGLVKPEDSQPAAKKKKVGNK